MSYTSFILFYIAITILTAAIFFFINKTEALSKLGLFGYCNHSNNFLLAVGSLITGIIWPLTFIILIAAILIACVLAVITPILEYFTDKFLL